MGQTRRGFKHVPEDYTFAEGCIAWGVAVAGGVGLTALLLMGVM